MKKIVVGIVGYGNLGKGVEEELKKNSDMELAAVFTRRPPESLEIESNKAEVVNVDEAEKYRDKIDVLFLCGGSATDLPVQGPKFSRLFNTVDSYDNHNNISNYYRKINQNAEAGNNLSAISIGWDPGLFSLNRMLFEAVLPAAKGYTFWGRGVSQGHSDAVRRVDGVKDAVQYTIPLEDALESVREGNNPELSTDEKHIRECFVVAEEGADKEKIVEEIKSMPNYFAEYETTVNFITEEEMEKEHTAMPHGGFVFRSGNTGSRGENSQLLEFSLNLESNPEFTASVLIAYGRAVYQLRKEGKTGAITIFDIPPAYLSPESNEDLRKRLL